MNINIYKQEISDGIADQISSNSIYCQSLAKMSEVMLPELESLTDEELQRIGSSMAGDKRQFDLYNLESVLVSTGWNKNDDVFDREELWLARETPEDKPFNFMHNEKDIIGHITGNRVVDKSGVDIHSKDDLPEDFDILTKAVIYKEWSDLEQRSRVSRIISEIEEGKWFVSMECLFPAFDYAMISPNGEKSILERNEASAFLTKHLRAYGGEGEYNNYRVGRMLRNLSFSGKGLVSNPANPESLILSNESFSESKSIISTTSSIKESYDMSNELENQVSILKKELAESKSANEVLKEKVIAEQKAEFESQISNLESSLAEKQEEITKAEVSAKAESEVLESDIKLLKESLAQKEESLAAKEEDLKEKDEKLAMMKKKEAMMKRKAQLSEIGFSEEDCEATIATFEEVSEEVFENIVATMKKKGFFPFTKKDDKDKKDDKEDDKGKASDDVENLDLEAEGNENAAASLQNLDNQEDEADALRAYASNWFEKSVLKSTQNLKEGE